MIRERESPSPSLPPPLPDSGIPLHDERNMRLAAGSWGSILLAIPALFGLTRLVLWTAFSARGRLGRGIGPGLGEVRDRGRRSDGQAAQPGHLNPSADRARTDPAAATEDSVHRIFGHSTNFRTWGG